MTNMINTFPRETIEFLPVPIKVDNVLVTTGIEFCIVLGDARPTIWIPAVTQSGKIGVMIQGLNPGTYHIFARVTASPDFAVMNTGFIYIT
jgi:hypothetical protein